MVVTICHSLPANLSLTQTQIPLFSSLTPNSTRHSSNSIHFQHKTQFKIFCSSDEQPQQFLEGFSMLETDPPWESSNVWSIMALYFFSLHIPLGFGGLSLVAQLLNQHDLEPQFKAVIVLVIGTSELFAALCLLQFTAKPDHKSVTFFTHGDMQSKRNWLLAALLGFAVLIVAMSLTSGLADRLVGDESVNEQTVKEILLSGTVAQTSITLVYCIVAPLLEEIVYRRFLLASLAPSMQWYQAVLVSSGAFAAAHLSSENFIQLFIIGLVLGCSYCWTGDLRSSILLHSMYNALTLFIYLNA